MRFHAQRVTKQAIPSHARDADTSIVVPDVPTRRECCFFSNIQKLFDCFFESKCAERQGRFYSLKWVLKNKEEKASARLVVREIKRAKSEDMKLEPSDVFSAMPPVESLKALVSHVMTERVDKCGRNLVLAVLDVSRAQFYGV